MLHMLQVLLVWMRGELHLLWVLLVVHLRWVLRVVHLLLELLELLVG
jgi:hypothetical protein